MTSITTSDITNFITAQATELQNVKTELAKCIALGDKYSSAIDAAEKKYHFHTAALDKLQGRHADVDASYSAMKQKQADMESAVNGHKDAHAETMAQMKAHATEHSKQMAINAQAAAGLEAQIQSKQQSLSDLQAAVKSAGCNYDKLAAAHQIMTDKLKTAADTQNALDLERKNKARFQKDLVQLQGDYVDANGKHETWAQNHARILKELQDVKDGVATPEELADLKRRQGAEEKAIESSDLSPEEKAKLLEADKAVMQAANDALKEQHDMAAAAIQGHKDSYAELQNKYQTMWIKYQSLIVQNATIQQQIGTASSNIGSMQQFLSGNVQSIVESLIF